MGVLTAAGAMNSDATPAREPDPVTPEREETPDAPEPDAPPAEEKGEFVPMAKITPKKPGSRRSNTDVQIEQRLREFADNQTRERQTYEAKVQQAAQEVAQLRGQIEAMQRMPSASPAQASGPDPTQMRREARAALEAGKFDEYERMRDEAIQIESDRRAEAKVEAKFKEFRQQMPQPLNPAIQMLIGQHRNVALAGERGMRAVMLKDQELGELYNVPAGPERVRKAFEIADGLLGSQQQPTPPSYSRDSAAALSGVPTGRSSNGGAASEPGVTLTGLQREAARAAGLSPADYVRWSDPAKYVFNK